MCPHGNQFDQSASAPLRSGRAVSTVTGTHGSTPGSPVNYQESGPAGYGNKLARVERPDWLRLEASGGLQPASPARCDAAGWRARAAGFLPGRRPPRWGKVAGSWAFARPPLYALAL
jgi:hypothetical protein